ncbi:hypothetical protein [Rugosimonospora africana]|nr:hypothetical protein [Rugosimonospora africana]
MLVQLDGRPTVIITVPQAEHPLPPEWPRLPGPVIARGASAADAAFPEGIA